MEINKISSIDELNELKALYFALATAPLDGMWHFGFVAMSDHFGFYENNNLVGYCCINADGYMLQFYLSATSKTPSTELFMLIAQNNSSVMGDVKGAFVSTAENDYLSLCLDNSSSFKVNAWMYQEALGQQNEQAQGLPMQLATPAQLTEFVAFAATNIGALESWLSRYYGNLIQRNELLGYWKNGELVATGECRLFDELQSEYVDLGMIVAQSARGKGIATRVLQYLVKNVKSRGLKAI